MANQFDQDAATITLGATNRIESWIAALYATEPRQPFIRVYSLILILQDFFSFPEGHSSQDRLRALDLSNASTREVGYVGLAQPSGFGLLSKSTSKKV